MGLHINLHAFLKSLLFVGVGYIILMVCHDQDFRGFSLGGSVRGMVGVLVIRRLFRLVGLTYFRGWFTKDGFMEYLLFQGLGLIVWLVIIGALATRGVYSLKLLFRVMMQRLCKVPLLVDWKGLLGSLGVMLCLGVMLGGVIGIILGL